MKITLNQLREVIKSIVNEEEFKQRPDQAMHSKDVKGHQVRVRPAITKPGQPVSWQTFRNRNDAEDFIKNSWPPGDYVVVGSSNVDNGTLTITDTKQAWFRPGGR